MSVAAFIASPNLPCATRRSRLAVLITAEGTGAETSAREPPEPADAPRTDPVPVAEGANGAAAAPNTAEPAGARRLCLAAVAPPPALSPDDPAPPAHPAAAPASPESTTVAATAALARR